MRSSGLRATGLLDGSFALEAVSDSMGEVVSGAKLVVVCVPAFARPYVAGQLAGVIEPDATVLFHPGYLGDSLELFRHAGRGTLSTVELSASIFGSAVVEPGLVNIFVRKASVEVATTPSDNVSFWSTVVTDLFELPTTTSMNCLTVGLANPNPTYHVPVCLTSIPAIELGLSVGYNDLITPSVLSVLEHVDDERVALMNAVSTGNIVDFWSFLRASYPVHATDHASMLKEAYGPYEHVPHDLNSRYITEDVPFGLVPWEAVGQVLGVATPTISALVDLASAARRTDFRKNGRNRDALGLREVDDPRALTRIFEGL